MLQGDEQMSKPKTEAVLQTFTDFPWWSARRIARRAGCAVTLVYGLVGVGRDITERKQAEAKRKAQEIQMIEDQQVL